jgi:hypothetical protein
MDNYKYIVFVKKHMSLSEKTTREMAVLNPIQKVSDD